MLKSKEWDSYKFHCSGLPKLMVSGKGKNEQLGKTAKSYLKEIWIYRRLDRKKYDNVNAYTDKGTMIESDSIGILSKERNTFYAKNNTLYENDYICGTPDITDPLIDIKSSWDIFTFLSVEETDAKSSYLWQLKGYSWLLSSPNSELIYVLASTPPEIAENELYRLSYKNLTESQLEHARRNYYYDEEGYKLPEGFSRTKSFAFTSTEEEFEKIKTQVLAAREYLKELDSLYFKTI